MKRSHRLALILLATLGVVAIVGPWLTGFDPRAQDLYRVREFPSLEHWFGTDHLGRDLFTRWCYALRLSLTLGISTAAVACFVGGALGILTAWQGGWIDRILTGFADAVFALPGLLLVLLVAAIAPGAYIALYLGIALSLWVEFFRVSRVCTRQILSGRPVEAARLLGFPPKMILKRYVLPELAPLIAPLAAFAAASAVLAMATLGFVGVGLQPPASELGVMMIELFPYWREAPWLLAAPIFALIVLTAAFLLLSQREDHA